jgi:hypothetical protein
VTGRTRYDDARLRGTVYGSAGDGLVWVLRADRPPWHPGDGISACDGPCCWAKGDADPRWLIDPNPGTAP